MLDNTIAEIFLAKLKEPRTIKTGITCDQVASATRASSETIHRPPGTLLSLQPHDLRERVRCVARRSVVLEKEGGAKGRLEAVEAVTLQGRLISAEELSRFKGDFGLRKKES